MSSSSLSSSSSSGEEEEAPKSPKKKKMVSAPLDTNHPFIVAIVSRSVSYRVRGALPRWPLGPVYTKRQRQLCDDASNSIFIENNIVA